MVFKITSRGGLFHQFPSHELTFTKLIPAAACWLVGQFSEQGHASSTGAVSQQTDHGISSRKSCLAGIGPGVGVDSEYKSESITKGSGINVQGYPNQDSGSSTDYMTFLFLSFSLYTIVLQTAALKNKQLFSCWVRRFLISNCIKCMLLQDDKLKVFVQLKSVLIYSSSSVNLFSSFTPFWLQSFCQLKCQITVFKQFFWLICDINESKQKVTSKHKLASKHSQLKRWNHLMLGGLT